jgi:hypothetical protein
MRNPLPQPGATGQGNLNAREGTRQTPGNTINPYPFLGAPRRRNRPPALRQCCARIMWPTEGWEYTYNYLL